LIDLFGKKLAKFETEIDKAKSMPVKRAVQKILFCSVCKILEVGKYFLIHFSFLVIARIKEELKMLFYFN